VNNPRSFIHALVWLALSAPAAAAPVSQWELGVVLTRTPNVERGAALYESCAGCHGAKGEGASDGTVPAIAGQSYTVLAKQIVDIRAGVRSDLRMEHSVDRKHLPFSQPIADVAQYIAGLPPAPPKPAPEGVNTAGGAAAYEKTCARCHGRLGEGKEDTLAPRLAGQHYNYILKQLDAAPKGDRPTMVRSHASLQEALTRRELEGIAGYLTTIGTSPLSSTPGTTLSP
jgi:cytochrome c553